MKPCSRCKQTKQFSQFRINTRMRCGHDSWCNACRADHLRSKRVARIAASSHICITEKKCYRCETTKEPSDFNRERGNRDGLSSICRTCRSKKHFEDYAKNPDEWKRKAREANRRRDSKPGRILHKRVSARVREWLGTKKGGRKCFDVLGYTLGDLRAHLERQFVKGMGWENIGSWHIDHIVPLSAFDAANDDLVKRAWALTNLRPLWATDNLRKLNKREFLL